MDLLQILKWLAVAVSLLIGLYAMIKPGKIAVLSGLAAAGPRGTTEIRAVMGGMRIGLAIAVVILNDPAAFKMLGFAWAATAVIRAVSMALDKSADRSGAISLIVEIILAILLVL